MSTPRKTGRRPGDPAVTRTAILDAAKRVFGEAGFERATIRAIAVEANVDPALVHHHFGTKQALFAAAHEIPIDVPQLVLALAGLPKEQLAEQIVRMYLSIFGEPGSPALSLLRAAATNDPAALMLREYLESALLDNAHVLIDQPDARLRIALIGSHMIGVLFAREIVALPEIADRKIDELVPVLVPMVQRYLTDPNLVGHLPKPGIE